MEINCVVGNEGYETVVWPSLALMLYSIHDDELIYPLAKERLLWFDI